MLIMGKKKNLNIFVFYYFLSPKIEKKYQNLQYMFIAIRFYYN